MTQISINDFSMMMHLLMNKLLPAFNIRYSQPLLLLVTPPPDNFCNIIIKKYCLDIVEGQYVEKEDSNENTKES